MSRSASSSAPKINAQPSRSAWSKGPPQSSSAPSRSQSPAPSTQSQPTHSRRPSTLGQGVPVKDGVSVPRNNVGAVKQGAPVTFGSIDDVSAPISSSPASAPQVKSEGVKSFGSLPNTHVNGKASLSSRSAAGPSPSSSSIPAVSVPAATPSKPKMDIRKFFQNPPSQPSTSSTSNDTSSPATRPSPLPSHASSNQSTQPPLTPSSHPSFTPYPRPQQQNTGPSNGPPPRSPAYPRQLANGNGPRSQPGPSTGPSPVMSSPRLGSHPPAGMPPPPPPMSGQVPGPQMPWPAYYFPNDQPYMPYTGWYMQMPPPPQHQHPHQHQHQHQHQHPPHHPPSGPHGTGVPMSPRTHPPPLQGPGTPTIPHAASPVPHPPPISHAPSSSMGSMSSPPPTPSSALPGPGRLNANSSTFVPGGSAPPKKVTLKRGDGTEVNIETLKITPASSASTPTSARQNLPLTPTRKTGTVRIETPEQRQKRVEEEEQLEKSKVEAEEKARKEKEDEEKKKREEEERKKKEEEARIRKEEEEKERLRKEEEEKKERLRREEEKKERLRKEEEAKEKERLRQEEEEKEKERQRKEEEERQNREEEERKQKEEDERIRLEEAKAREEEERLKREEEERRRQEEEEVAKAKTTVEDEVEPEPEMEGTKMTDSPLTPEPEEGELSLSKDDVKEKSGGSLRIDTALSARRRPDPLNLSHSRQPSSPLTLARPLADLGSITYPAGISSPNPELNAGAKEGKFRYDRDFLLQFMLVCKEKPDSLPSLDAIGLEPADQLSLTRGGSGRSRQLSGANVPSRQASIGGGVVPGGTNLRSQYQSMGQFTTSSKFGPGAERFETGGGRSVSLGGAPVPFRNPPMQRTPSGPGGSIPSHRTRSKRGEKRTDSTKVGPTGPQAHGPVYGQQHAGFSPPAFEHVAPLQMSENRWDRKAIVSNDPDAPEVVDRKVKGLLNKLTMEKFDSISDQIIQWANRSENQKDGRTLIQVIRLVFEKATDEATWSEMYARLCRKMMEQISTNVHDEGIKNAEGKPIAGGQLFRKYLLNRCQEDFERGWVAKEAAAAAAAIKAKEDQAIKDANERNGSGEEVALYSEEYYIAQKAKRQGLGLIKFIGELFKLQMLTERIMHECIKKLLGNVHDPEEEEIESLCKLMTTVGLLLDTQRGRAHMDVYFQRMKELTQNLNVSPRMQFMLQDVLELRERKWIARNASAGPATLAQIHEAAAKEKAAQEKESTQRISMSRGGSRRGGNREDFPQADGWTVNTTRASTRAGDLSQFGRISKAQQPTTFGPGSVFAGKKEIKRESISRTNSSSNMFSMLEASQENKAALEPPQRKKLMLQPRTKPLEEPTHPEESVTPSEEDASALGEINEEAADAKIKEDVKEFFNVRNLDEAEVYFTTLPPQHHQSLVNQLTSSAVESKEPDARLVADLFTRAKNKGLCSPDAFEEGLTPTAEIIEDIAIDAPKAWTLFAIIVNGAELDEEHRTRLASKSTDSDKLLGLLSS